MAPHVESFDRNVYLPFCENWTKLVYVTLSEFVFAPKVSFHSGPIFSLIDHFDETLWLF